MGTHVSAFNRRRLLGIVGTGALGVVAAACGASPPSPTTAPVKPAEATKPAAAATTAPAAGATTAAAKPAEATKPVAAATTAPAAAAPAKIKPGTEIRLHVRTGSEEDTLKEVLPQFTADKGVPVKVEAFPGGEYYTKVQTLIAGGQLGDVLWTVNYRGTFLWAFNKLIRPLDDLVKADGFDTAQYIKAAYEAGLYEGRLYGMPFKIHPGPVALYFNSNKVDAAGVKMPDKQFAKWDDLIGAAKQLTKSSGGRVEQFGLTTGLTAAGAADTWKKINMYVRAFGGEIYSEDGAKSLLDTEQAKAGIRFLHALMFDHKIAPNLQESPATADEIFIAERALLYQAESGSKSLPTRIKEKFTVKNVMMPPGPAGKIGTNTIVDHIVISANTKAAPESWELTRLLCGKEVGIRLGEGQGGASGTSGGRLDVLNDARLTKNPLHPIFIDLLNQAQVVRLASNFRDEELNTVFHQVSAPIWLGERQPDDAFFKEFNAAVQGVLDKPKA